MSAASSSRESRLLYNKSAKKSAQRSNNSVAPTFFSIESRLDMGLENPGLGARGAGLCAFAPGPPRLGPARPSAPGRAGAGHAGMQPVVDLNTSPAGWRIGQPGENLTVRHGKAPTHYSETRVLEFE